MERHTAVDRLEAVVDAIETEPMPVPVREVWAFGDVALGLDPVDRLDIYVTKDVLFGGGRRREGDDVGDGSGNDSEDVFGDGADGSIDFEEQYGVKGIGGTVRTEWAAAYPDAIRTNDNGYAAPEKCLAAHLIAEDEPIHLEVCNASFEDNVTQRLKGALARDAYGEILDPRGVCLWVDGERDPEAFERLRAGEFAMPTLEAALGMLGADDDVASAAAETLKAARAEADGASVRGDVV